MSRLQFFIITSTAIFILEWVLSVLVSWPIFIFPVFVIFFLLTRPTFASQNLGGQASKKETNEILCIAVVSFIFDFFSGYRFGFMTFAILTVALIIFFFKTRFNISSQSPISLFFYSLIFVFIFVALLSIKSDTRLIITQAPVIIIETFVLFVIFIFWFRVLKTRPTA